MIVPQEFRPHHPVNYPPDNDLIFEEWFYTKSHPITEREYLPVFWTSYYCKHKFGQDQRAIAHLQNWLNRLPRDRKYYTISQYDDGILNNISHLDIKVFAPCGNRIDYPIPLLCKPHEYAFPRVKKDIVCSYIGTNNHPIRTGLMKFQQYSGWYISDRPHKLQLFCEVLARSKYVLCPRGYGVTSFRIQEALQYGAIPVYISDKHVIPHNEFGYGVLASNVGPELTDMIELDIPRTPAREAFEKWYTYDANLKLIHDQL